jgi:hypothetical protein
VREDVTTVVGAVERSQRSPSGGWIGAATRVVAILTGAALLTCSAAAVQADQTSQAPNRFVTADGCCVCRTKTAAQGYVSAGCSDVRGIDACHALCQQQQSRTVVFTSGATCASGCRGAAARP